MSRTSRRSAIVPLPSLLLKRNSLDIALPIESSSPFSDLCTSKQMDDILELVQGTTYSGVSTELHRQHLIIVPWLYLPRFFPSLLSVLGEVESGKSRENDLFPLSLSLLEDGKGRERKEEKR